MHIRGISKARPMPAVDIDQIWVIFVQFVDILYPLNELLQNLLGVSIGDFLAKCDGTG